MAVFAGRHFANRTPNPRRQVQLKLQHAICTAKIHNMDDSDRGQRDVHLKQLYSRLEACVEDPYTSKIYALAFKYYTDRRSFVVTIKNGLALRGEETSRWDMSESWVVSIVGNFLQKHVRIESRDGVNAGSVDGGGSDGRPRSTLPVSEGQLKQDLESFILQLVRCEEVGVDWDELYKGVMYSFVDPDAGEEGAQEEGELPDQDSETGTERSIDQGHLSDAWMWGHESPGHESRLGWQGAYGDTQQLMDKQVDDLARGMAAELALSKGISPGWQDMVPLIDSNQERREEKRTLGGIRSGDTECQCPVCGAVFASPHAAYQHTQVMHPMPKE